MMLKHSLFLSLIIFIFSNSSVLSQNKKELKRQQRLEDYKKTKSLISEGDFRFTADWLTPRNGRQVNLTTNYNEIIFKKDSVKADLPYFGVVQIPSINSDGGINFEEKNIQFHLEFNDKKQKINLTFQAKNKSETFDFNMTIYGSGNTSIFVTSTHRNPITYDGNIYPLKKTDNP